MKCNFGEVLPTSFFKSLDLETTIGLLNSPDLALETEVTRLEAIVTWIDYNLGSRLANSEALLDLVDWSLIPEEFSLDNHKLSANSSICQSPYFR